TEGMLQLRNSNLTAVRDIVDGVPNNVEDFGIEEEGPVPTSHPDLVSVPQSTVEVSYEQETAIQQAIAAVPLDENGITSYLTALSAFERLIE
ncbi:Hypothetical predicted protein, partial [Paramuricea clavata]